MSSSAPGQRPIRLPPPDFEKQVLPRTRQFPRDWFRVHPRSSKAIVFSLNPTHRYSHPQCPSKVVYVGMDPETCFWECFGDRVFDGGRTLRRAVWENSGVSTIAVPPMHLCDLSKKSTRSELAVDLSALMDRDISIPQEWGLAIQKHPAQVPAIKFRSRFTDTACLAIFERGSVPAQLKETVLSPLSRYEPALRWLEENRISLV